MVQRHNDLMAMIPNWVRQEGAKSVYRPQFETNLKKPRALIRRAAFERIPRD